MTAALHQGALVPSAMIGSSDAMRRLRATIEVVAPTRLPVLIQGPTGSGKELVASAIHSSSGRTGAFVALNVCAISDSMFEDALFGHVRGAFTGAHSDADGFLKEAHRGTLFLDEIGGLAMPQQAKLLRAIETGVFRQVGAKRDTSSEFRVVAATNEGLHDLVAAGRFRADLAHRIAAIAVDVPSLAERLDDLRELTVHFLEAGGYAAAISDETLNEMRRHLWPGNVRELKHFVECSAAMSGGSLHRDHVRTMLEARGASAWRVSMADGAHHGRELRALLERHGWDTGAVAKEMNVHRATLYRRMRRLGIVPQVRRLDIMS